MCLSACWGAQNREIPESAPQSALESDLRNFSSCFFVGFEDQILTPTHPLTSLVRISIYNQVSNGSSWKKPGRGKNCSHCNFQDCRSPIDTGSESKIGKLGGWGGKRSWHQMLAQPIWRNMSWILLDLFQGLCRGLSWRSSLVLFYEDDIVEENIYQTCTLASQIKGLFSPLS